MTPNESEGGNPKLRIEMEYRNRLSQIFIGGILMVVLIVFTATRAAAQTELSSDSTQFLMKNSPAFTIYKDNYFVTGTTVKEAPSKFNSDAKFQFSFKLRLQNTPVFWNSYLYLTYTQKSFWDIYQDSKPFAETNYNPGLLLAKPIYQKDNLKGMLMISIEHESNGRDSIYSRSWNYVGIGYSHHFTEKTKAGLKVFIPYSLDDNPDLTEYIGLAEGQFTWSIFKDKLELDMIGRKGADLSLKGNLTTTLSYRPTAKRNIYWSLQWFMGYGESLIDYEEVTNMVRFGITIKPEHFRIY